MKRLVMLFTPVLLTMIFSSPSYAKWTEVGTNTSGMTFYVDFERIRKHGGYVYWYDLIDLLKPDKDGDVSYKGYRQGDCKLFRYKYLNSSFYKKTYGGGTGKTVTPENPEWKYPNPNSMKGGVLKSVCSK
jgi:hypothetical protein